MALARALVFDPQLVLMDEPLGALDKQLREHMQLEIKHIHESLGVTVVYVTHDQTEALTMSDRIAVFNQGIIQQIDLPDRLYQQPSNSFVANFIGENNRLNGIVREVSGGICRVELTTGQSVFAAAVAVREPGQPTTLSIRPERIGFQPTSSRTGQPPGCPRAGADLPGRSSALAAGGCGRRGFHGQSALHRQCRGVPDRPCRFRLLGRQGLQGARSRLARLFQPCSARSFPSAA